MVRITTLPPAAALEALDKLEDDAEIRRTAQEVNVVFPLGTPTDQIKQKIREVIEHFKDRDGSPQMEISAKRVGAGVPADAPILPVAGAESEEIPEDQKETGLAENLPNEDPEVLTAADPVTTGTPENNPDEKASDKKKPSRKK